MADSIYTFDPVAANNTALDTIPYGPNQLYHNQIDNWFRALAAKLAQHVDDLGGVNTVAGTANAITATIASGITAYATGHLFWFKNTGGPNTTAATMNVNSIGAKEIRLQGDSALTGGELLDNGYYGLLYDAAYDGGDGGWVLLNPTITASTVETTWQSTNTPINLSLAATVNSNALTIAIKGHDGNDPSASNKVYVPFRSVTANSGDNDVLTVTAATSVVVSSGSTLGTSSGVAATLAVVAFNDGGTFRLGVVNPTSLPLKDGIASSTAEGGAGAADSAGTIYTGTAVTSKAMRVLGFITITEATAGTWASAPTTVQVGDAASVCLQTVGGVLVASVNFNGTGTVAIRSSSNVSSITDNGTGDYTVNFTKPLADIDYWVTGAVSGEFGTRLGGPLSLYQGASPFNEVAPTTSAFRFAATNSSNIVFDPKYVSILVFR